MDFLFLFCFLPALFMFFFFWWQCDAFFGFAFGGFV